MRAPVFDTKVKRQFKHYAAQVTLATACLFAVLWAEQLIAGPQLSRAVVIGAIGATAFTLFISPHRQVATMRHVLGGYLVSLVIAGTLSYVFYQPVGNAMLLQYPVLFPVGAATAVGGAMFMMAATNTEHPPAVGASLAIAAHDFHWQLIAFVAGSVLVMVAVQRAVRRWLIDLY